MLQATTDVKAKEVAIEIIQICDRVMSSLTATRIALMAIAPRGRVGHGGVKNLSEISSLPNRQETWKSI